MQIYAKTKEIIRANFVFRQISFGQILRLLLLILNNNTNHNTKKKEREEQEKY